MPSTDMAAQRPMTTVSGSRLPATAAFILPTASSSETTDAPCFSPKGVGSTVSSMDMAQTSAASSSDTVRMTFSALP